MCLFEKVQGCLPETTSAGKGMHPVLRPWFLRSNKRNTGPSITSLVPDVLQNAGALKKRETPFFCEEFWAGRKWKLTWSLCWGQIWMVDSHCLWYVSGMFLLGDEILVVEKRPWCREILMLHQWNRRRAVPKTIHSWLEWMVPLNFQWTQPSMQFFFSDESGYRTHDEKEKMLWFVSSLIFKWGLCSTGWGYFKRAPRGDSRPRGRHHVRRT